MNYKRVFALACVCSAEDRQRRRDVSRLVVDVVVGVVLRLARRCVAVFGAVIGVVRRSRASRALPGDTQKKKKKNRVVGCHRNTPLCCCCIETLLDLHLDGLLLAVAVVAASLFSSLLLLLLFSLLLLSMLLSSCSSSTATERARDLDRDARFAGSLLPSWLSWLSSGRRYAAFATSTGSSAAVARDVLVGFGVVLAFIVVVVVVVVDVGVGGDRSA